MTDASTPPRSAPGTARSTSTDPRAERVRTALLRAGYDLLRDRPIGEISVPELVARAGVSRPVFYKHFADRDDLLATTVMQHMDDAVAGACDDADAVRLVLAWAQAHRVLYAHMHPSDAAQRVSAHLRGVVRPWCRTLVAQARLAWPDEDRAEVERFVVGGLLELVRTAAAAEPPRPIDPAEIMRLTARLARARQHS